MGTIGEEKTFLIKFVDTTKFEKEKKKDNLLSNKKWKFGFLVKKRQKKKLKHNALLKTENQSSPPTPEKVKRGILYAGSGNIEGFPKAEIFRENEKKEPHPTISAWPTTLNWV